ncbi:MAG: helix-turn-helix domain-containing protein [Muribaculum sp.]|nr:helix-turn-helix domain-containing protein [Muribaculum sp.]
MTQQYVKFSDLFSIKEFATDFSRLGKDYILTRFESNALPSVHTSNPFRFDGLTILLSFGGLNHITVNMTRYDVPQNAFIIIPPESIINADDVNSEELSAYMLFLSTDFLESINIDTSVIGMSYTRRQHTSPVLSLANDEAELLRKYLDLLHLNASCNDSSPMTRSIGRNLVAALMYQLIEFGNRHVEPEENEPTYSRRVNYVHEFMRLVKRYYRTERSVGFYAEKLFISPKYLSLIIKETTGRSAAQWIAEHVILEAKNMLRFSGKNIQQIAYDLNFTNQSSFGKYFKHMTGMSPSEFQKS